MPNPCNPYRPGDLVTISGSHPEWCPQGLKAPFAAKVYRTEGMMVGVIRTPRVGSIVQPTKDRLDWWPLNMVHKAIHL